MALSALSQRFQKTWRRLAKRGACDSIFGAEFLRVFSDWWENGRPRTISQFILERTRWTPSTVAGYPPANETDEQRKERTQRGDEIPF